ncbi:hypothetical protein D9613_012256 [Agrocybe pediades]|uniref:Uncharacterized protein n=1 Tax=Agrocybe pediades TaxID=84607 RepID=A0A8H4QEN6_9AGAR|nr:hypothetical protein D9613_012256 [Agrocybe pediades]
MSHQQAPIPQQGPQRWASRHSPPNGSNSTSSNGHSDGHSSNMSMGGSSSNGGAQYVDYPASPPQMAVRSPGPSTPFGMDDSTTTRLLAGQSQPSSPVPGDFASPLPHNAPQMAQYGQHGQRAVPTRSGSGTASSGFASSPLNPSQLSSSAHSTSTISNPFNGTGRGPTSRPASRGSTKNPGLVNPNNFPMPSSPNYKSGASGVPEDGVISSLGLGSNNSGFPPSMGQRGSMVLYRVADTPSRSASASGLSSLAAASAASAGRGSPDDPLLQPPRFGPGKRTSYASSSGDSIASLADSKYPATLGTGAMGSVRGLIPYAYDPAMDENEPFDEEDLLHDPNPNAYLNDRYRGTRKGALAAGKHSKLGPGASAGLGAAAAGGRGKGNIPVPAWEKKHFPWRGVFNVGVLVLLILGLLCLFVFYPVLTFYRDKARNLAIQGNIRINGTASSKSRVGIFRTSTSTNQPP